MHARETVPLSTLAILAGTSAIGIWLAEFLIPGFSGPPWQTVVSIVAIAVVVGVIGRPSEQLDLRAVPSSTEPDPQPSRPLRNAANEGFAGPAAQPAFQPADNAYAILVTVDRSKDRTTLL